MFNKSITIYHLLEIEPAVDYRRYPHVISILSFCILHRKVISKFSLIKGEHFHKTYETLACKINFACDTFCHVSVTNDRPTKSSGMKGKLF